MKNILATIIFLFCISGAFTQTLPNNIDPHSGFIEAYDVNGKPFAASNKPVAGLSVLNDSWGKGEVKFRNGFTLKDMDLKFDLFSNELHFRKDSIEYSFVDPLKEFTMVYPQNDEMRSVVFRSGYPRQERKTENTFYQVVADGQKLQLLNYMSKQVREEYEYLNPVTKSYQLDNAYFVYDVKSGVLKKVNLNKTSFMKALPKYADAIQKFSAEKNYKLNSEIEAKELFQNLNQL